MAEKDILESGNLCIADETYQESLSKNYHLSIQVGIHEISFCILDTPRNKYIALYDFSYPEFNDFAAITQPLKNLMADSALLHQKYKSVSCMLVNDEATLVPAPLYEESKTEDYLNFNLCRNKGLNGMKNPVAIGSEYPYSKDVIAVDRLKQLEAYTVYSVPENIRSALINAHTDVRFMHYSTSLIESVLSKFKNQNRSFCLLNFQKKIFNVLIVEGNKLRFYNSFSINTKEDMAYYTLFIFEQLNLNPETSELLLSGEIDKNSEHYNILNQYIRNIGFFPRNDQFDYSYRLKELPGHYFFNLFSLFQCVS